MNRTWLGVGVVVILAVALALVLSSGDDTPATTTIAPTAAPTTATPPPSTRAATTTAAPTTTASTPPTTVDPEVRAAEIEALVTELELRLLQAVYDQDRDALEDVVAGKRLWDALQPAFENPEEYFSARPDAEGFVLTFNDVVLDRGDCIVADVEEDATAFYLEYDQVDAFFAVPWPSDSGQWRIADLWDSGTPESEWRRTCDLQDRSWRP